MNRERLFVDTVFIQAILNKHDQYHLQAIRILPRIKNAHEVWLTEAILMEVGNALSSINRQSAVNFIKQCYQTVNINVVNVSSELFNEGLTLYESRLDKTWGLVDCISFVVMQQQELTDAVTVDVHFVQAGFRALMLE
ncbi:nucleic acid-binding protein [Aphanothece hegewaldii CCALA 016]|uniref:Nucleic acid-binding protein n=1 Tax=Aphanothece hegewaldii CCALA 016 TaxID=2107694 RepID=A0A2T1LZ29_9CHRO|nr:PIN domain-containing protein [Aphanothece hegewaldii]PSF37657.1 nucleic acid-binding protein [Aphanothece hegewaldii CCALA 016]